MSQVRLLIPKARWSSPVALDSREVHRLTLVLRMQEGDVLEVFDGQGARAGATLQRELGDWVLYLQDPSQILIDSPEIVLAVAVLKGRKLDDVVRQTTEIGVTRIMPVLCSRSVARPDAARSAKRLERWRIIAAEASRQSGRSALPQVDPVQSFDAWLDWLREEGQDLDGVILHLEAGKTSGLDLWSSEEPRRLVLTGPEGGFSEEEVQAACKAGLRVHGLGQTVLRAETAAVVAAAFAVLTGGRGSDK
ncbi:MAG: 16S rRNA (uracil(1498)-N(3))-methyltransferase [Deltaproteobacteria bacterium]|nr:16S rRNA (uracil(1498)-N(3))-methyltransferase [Deltaproteobacteria bacterium]